MENLTMTQTKAAALYMRMTTGAVMTPEQKQYWDMQRERVKFVDFIELCSANNGFINGTCQVTKK